MSNRFFLCGEINIAYRPVMVDFRELETFFWVATLGSFRGAAAKLNTTQPAISQRVAALEAQLGVRVLSRETRAIAPTPRGRELLVYAEKLLGLRAEMLEAVGDVSTARGVLRLGVAETVVHTWLTPFLKAVSDRFPQLALEIEVDISPNLRERLRVQELDLAFLIGPLNAPNAQKLPLAVYPLAFISSPTIEWPKRAARIEEVAQHPIVTFSRNTQPYSVVASLFNRPHMPPARLHASASLATVVRMTVENLGVAVIPPAIVAGELRRGELRIVRCEAKLPDLVFDANWVESIGSRTAAAVAAIAATVAKASIDRPRTKRLS
ncbi:MAG: LysR family transcriptional regulator [Hyphomicrobiales bacterium]|nr:LysR family transcriptional regulator [Hyphomicrobiales bacterium]